MNAFPSQEFWKAAFDATDKEREEFINKVRAARLAEASATQAASPNLESPKPQNPNPTVQTSAPCEPPQPATGSGPAPVPARPRYQLRRGLGGWHVVFDWAERVLRDEKALGYVWVLLLDPPPEYIHGCELDRRAFGHAVVEQQRNLGLEDAETARAMAAARAQCQAIIDSETANEAEREEARAQLQEIQEWARKHLRGVQANEQRQVRAIRQCIRRFLQKLRTARNPQGEPDRVLRAFGEHLERYLWEPSSRAAHGRDPRVRSALAGRFTYEPPPGIDWKP